MIYHQKKIKKYIKKYNLLCYDAPKSMHGNDTVGLYFKFFYTTRAALFVQTFYNYAYAYNW